MEGFNGFSPAERRILTIAPGMTDYASIRFRNEGEILSGSTDPDRDYMEKIHPEKMRLSLEYVDGRSLGGDIRIIAATLKAVIR
jgi:lipopolysaccharide/colanic/teichoic acid biosynthesis glycosyltransferase